MMNLTTPKLKGATLTLELFAEKHLTDRYVAWLNDPVVCRDNRHGRELYTMEKARTFYETVKSSDNQYTFAIVCQDGHEHVGNLSLSSISRENKSAQIAILIGERSAWGKGIGFEACRLVMDFGFGELDLHRIWMGMTTRNAAMIRICEKLGMHKEGIARDALQKDGDYLDIVHFAKINSLHQSR